MADSTRELASRTEDPEIKAAYLDLAAKWVGLARQAAQELHEIEVPSPLRRRRAADEDGPTA